MGIDRVPSLRDRRRRGLEVNGAAPSGETHSKFDILVVTVNPPRSSTVGCGMASWACPPVSSWTGPVNGDQRWRRQRNVPKIHQFGGKCLDVKTMTFGDVQAVARRDLPDEEGNMGIRCCFSGVAKRFSTEDVSFCPIYRVFRAHTAVGRGNQRKVDSDRWVPPRASTKTK